MTNRPRTEIHIPKTNYLQQYFFCSFYLTLSLHANNQICMSNGVSYRQYKDKEGTYKNTPQNVNFQNIRLLGQKL